MLATLRRSCNACAKAKLKCDLKTPRCSRCTKRKTSCVYANEPLTASTGPRDKPRMIQTGTGEMASIRSTIAENRMTLLQRQESPSPFPMLISGNTFFDPFDSYPTTRLPRVHVQRLIRHFLSSIAFQYYPLDMSMKSNPFVVSWWPLALEDPALFHVSLQTASLDEEVRAQKGFPMSEILMADSVSLVRRKVEDSAVAFRDDTLNSVVTLAAIEHGKGNVQASRMHIEGIKRMVAVRGGINAVRKTSPLTARMISWVSLLVTESPQFQTQDDNGSGDGINPILRWYQLSLTIPDIEEKRFLDNLDVDPTLQNVLARLRSIFHSTRHSRLTSTELHDLTCFAIHKLLLLPPFSVTNLKRSAVSECLRFSISLYMLVLHGTTYYSHIYLANTLLVQLSSYLKALAWTGNVCEDLRLWFLSLGLASASTLEDRTSFFDQAYTAAAALGFGSWNDVLPRLQTILWLNTPQGDIIQYAWETVFETTAQSLVHTPP